MAFVIIRSIRHGLGPDALKDSFDPQALGPMVCEVRPDEVFDIQQHASVVDTCIIGLWYMLREIEISNAKAGHLYLPGSLVRFLLPVQKNDSQGDFTERTLACSCSVRRHALCPWHAAQRHIRRLNNLQIAMARSDLPLFPGPEVKTLSKT